MAKMDEYNVDTPNAHISVKEALKRTLEGELLELAVVPTTVSEQHSKTGSHSHSKCGHDHSKYGGDEETAFSEVDEQAYSRFAERLVKLQQEI